MRLEFYTARLFSGQEISGADKDYDDLHRAYQIAILDKERFFNDDTFIHTFEYYDPVHRTSLQGLTRIITLELCKLEKVITKPPEALVPQENWAIFFRYLTDKSKRNIINTILEREEGIAMASEVLVGFSKTEAEYLRRMSEDKYRLDMQSYMVQAKRQARQEGLQEGIEKKAVETARKMKADKMPMEQIIKYTNLTEKQINDLEFQR